MPCGQLDKRRGGHRCTACRKGHRQCNGQQPCLSCQRRSLKCIFSQEAAPGLQIVRHSPPLRKALTQSSWMYISLYMGAGGTLPQSAVMHSDMVVALSHKDECVNTALAVVGQALASHRDKNLLQGRQWATLGQSLALQKSICSHQMKQPITESGTSYMLCALLLAIADLLMDPSADSWRSWMAEISKFINRVARNVLSPSSFNIELIRIYQLNDVLGAVSRHEMPLGPDFSAGRQETGSVSTNGGNSSSATSEPNDYDQVLSIMWQWSVLQYSILQWVENACSQVLPNLSCEQRVQGTQLVQRTLSLQLNILRIFLPSQNSLPSNSRFQDPYYRWILLCISKLLQNRAFSQLDCELPMMPIHCSRYEALAAFNYVEESSVNSVLDSVSFLPLLDTIAEFVESEDGLVRLLRFLGNLELCGFKVAREYRQEILETSQG